MLEKISLQNGEEIAYRKRNGGDRVLILVHGNMTSSKHWDLLLDSLDPSFTVYALDLRGFGQSTYHQPIDSIKDFSEDVKAFVNQLHLKDFFLVGWSTGGAVCMQFVADYPGYCAKLVLLSSASTRGYPMYALHEDGSPKLDHRLKNLEEVKENERTIAMQALYDEENREGLKAVWESLIYTNNKPEASRYEEYIDDMLTQRNLAEVYHALNTFNISSVHNGLIEGSQAVEKITIPVLVIQGDRDLVVTEAMAQEILADLGDHAKYVLLEDTGHSALVDNLEGLTKEIESFLIEGDY